MTKPRSPEFEAAERLGLIAADDAMQKHVGSVIETDYWQAAPRIRNRLLTLEHIRAMPRPTPLIAGVLYSNMEHILFGPQGVTKTFLALDWSMHIAFGQRWMGHAVSAGRVVYVCGEGGGRIMADRLDAWLNHHEVSDETPALENFLITEYPVAMLDEDSVDELIELLPESVSMIFFDTLAANFGGGDENAQADMGRFCTAARRVRLASNAGVVAVHHTGHVDRTRPQGANILRRNFDIELRVDRDAEDVSLYGLLGGGELKSRHGKGCGLIPYRLESVTLDATDSLGETIGSVVIVPTQDIPRFEGQKGAGAQLGKNQETALAIIRSIARETSQNPTDSEGVFVASDKWLDGYKAAGLNKKQAYQVRNSFAERGWIVEAVGGFKWFP